MKVTKLISKTFINALEGKPSSVLSSKYTIEWYPDYQSYLVDSRIFIPLHNIIEVEVDLGKIPDSWPESQAVELSKKLKKFVK